ncbi:MAG: DUF1553 domain-containing protein [Opitutaceae bacterium]|nr:DUF1553 domain-containing protein [Opitutaceae bacterium]
MFPLRLSRSLLLPICFALAPAVASGSAATDDFFRVKVEPILRENCHKCHSHAAEKIKGGLLLDSMAAALEGGDSGTVIVPGHPEKSLLIEAIRYTNEDLQMPPKDKKLSAEDIATLTEWVRQGAPWPAEPEIAGPLKARRKGGGITAEDRQWWAFQPLAKVTPPPAHGWAVNEIDRFILARLRAEGLEPAPRAEKAALLRRVYFDLIGLPPPPSEVDAFLADSSPDAYARVMERLLSSPNYGERWATSWLDLVRYAESDGYKADDYRANAWRYRDYVIDAFNRDKPYDRFVQEQLAGDELWPDDPAARTATGYLAHWIYEYNQRDAVGQRETILNDLTDTTADAFLGVGLQCARCHDHKFDPLLQKDYFRLQAFFAPLRFPAETPVATAAEREAHARKLAAWGTKTTDLRRQLEELDAPYRRKAEEDAVKKFPPETQAMLAKPVAARTPFEQQVTALMWKQVEYEWEEKRFAGKLKEPARSKRNALLAELKKFEADKPAPLPVALATTDIGPVAPPVKIPKKPALGEIAPGFPTILQEQPAEIAPVTPATTGRRTALARWITHPENPLTGRVIVNRIWQAHFGRGLAINPSDFGRLGEKPSHPELLDWLTEKFIAGGWSIKQLHRLIVLSATYTQSSSHPLAAVAAVKDPENRLLWRGSIRRLEAEQIRDAMLAATGELKLRRGGPSAEPEEPVRSVYQKARRNRHDPVLEVFDQPERFVSSAERNVTTTPSQSLLLFNSKWALERAGAFAGRLRKQNGGDEGRIVTEAFRVAVGRTPTAEEQRQALKFIDQQAARLADHDGDEEIVPFAAEKMRYRDGSAAVIAAGTPQERLVVPNAPVPPKGEFTIEAYINLKSAPDNDTVRTIVSQGGTKPGEPGWVFGVTGKRSHVPQTLVLKLFAASGRPGDSTETILSGLHIEPDTPYFVGVSARLNDASEQGITFFIKDLTDSDDPLRKVEVLHRLTGNMTASAPLVIGGTLKSGENLFDGLIDDVRLSAAALGPDDLLLSNSSVRVHTMGYWKFEAKADPFGDSSNHGHPVNAIKVKRPRPDARAVALTDFCQVLLNSNEFFYLE